MEEVTVNIPEGNSEPSAGALLAANPQLGATDMRDLLMEFGADGARATELTQPRRDAEHRDGGWR